MTMIAYQTDSDGVFVGAVVCDESPLEPGVFLVPAGAVGVAPPDFAEMQQAVWDGSAWTVMDIVSPIEPEPQTETWDTIRAQRDWLLASCDWTQLADAPVDSAAWAVYRQALRDIPQDFATPDEVVWPTPPS